MSIDFRLPIRARMNEEGEIVRILLIEPLYDVLRPATWIGRAISISSPISAELIERARKWLTRFILETGVRGWTITVSIPLILLAAVHDRISIRKFSYKTQSLGLGEGGFGTTLFGGGEFTEIVEYPVRG